MTEYSSYHFLQGLGKGLDERMSADAKSTREEFGDLLEKLDKMDDKRRDQSHSSL